MKLEPGIYLDIDWETYKKVEGINPSTLKKSMRSMKHLKRAIDGEIPPPKPETVAVGQAVHCMIAGEENRLAVMPQFELDAENVTATGKPSKTKTTSYYKSKKEAWEAENADVQVLSDVQMNTARKIVREIENNVAARQLIGESKHEITAVAEIEGVLCKTRLDGAVAASKRVWDLKVTSDIEPRTLYHQSKRMGYYFQFAFHCLVCMNAGKNRFAVDRYDMIAAENGGDYDVAVVEVPFQLLDDWMVRVKSKIRQYRESKESNFWPGLYESGQGMLDVPDYDMAENGVFEG